MASWKRVIGERVLPASHSKKRTRQTYWYDANSTRSSSSKRRSSACQGKSSRSLTLLICHYLTKWGTTLKKRRVEQEANRAPNGDSKPGPSWRNRHLNWTIKVESSTTHRLLECLENKTLIWGMSRILRSRRIYFMTIRLSNPRLLWCLHLQLRGLSTLVSRSQIIIHKISKAWPWNHHCKLQCQFLHRYR